LTLGFDEIIEKIKENKSKTSLHFNATIIQKYLDLLKDQIVDDIETNIKYGYPFWHKSAKGIFFATFNVTNFIKCFALY